MKLTTEEKVLVSCVRVAQSHALLSQAIGEPVGRVIRELERRGRLVKHREIYEGGGAGPWLFSTTLQGIHWLSSTEQERKEQEEEAARVAAAAIVADRERVMVPAGICCEGCTNVRCEATGICQLKREAA